MVERLWRLSTEILEMRIDIMDAEKSQGGERIKPSMATIAKLQIIARASTLGSGEKGKGSCTVS